MMRLRALFGLFLLVAALFIISNHELHLSNASEALTFARVYYLWIVHIGSVIARFTGEIVSSSMLNSNVTG